MRLLISPPFLFLISISLLIVGKYNYPELQFTYPYMGYIKTGLHIFGGIILVWAFSTLNRTRGASSDLDTEQTNRLIQTGIYRFTRNPIYLGFLIIICALGIAEGNSFGVIASSGFYFLVTNFQIKHEEKALREKFGDEYEAYCKKTRRWL